MTVTETRPHPWHRRFAARLALPVALLMAAIVSLQGAYTLGEQTRIAEESARRAAMNTARGLARAVRTPMTGNDTATIEELLRFAAEQPEVLRVRVADAHGRVVGHAVHPPGQAVTGALDRDEPLAVSGSAATLERHGERLTVREPVHHPELIGWVDLEYNLAPLAAGRLAVLQNTLIALVIAIVAVLLLVLLLLHRPLRAIETAARFAARLPAHRGGRLSLGRVPAEVEQIEQALNQAAQRLDTERRQVVHNARRLQETLNQAGDAILTLGPGGAILSANEAAMRMLGISLDDLTGKPLPDCLRLEAQARANVERELESAGRGEERPAFEFEGVTADGRYFIVEGLARRLRYENEPAGVQLTLREITGRRRLEQLAGRLGRMLGQSTGEIYVVDVRSFRYLLVSDGACRNLGFGAGELAGMTPPDLLPALTAGQFNALIEPLFDGRRELVVFDGEQRRRDGTRYPVRMRWQLSRNESPPLLLAIVEDLTGDKSAATEPARTPDRSASRLAD